MEVQAALNIATFLPVTLTAPELTESEFLAFCQQFPDSRLEYSGDGTLIIMPPTDPETGTRMSLTIHRLMQWAEKQGLGSVVGPDTAFLSATGPDGSRTGLGTTKRDRKTPRNADRVTLSSPLN